MHDQLKEEKKLLHKVDEQYARLMAEKEDAENERVIFEKLQKDGE